MDIYCNACTNHKPSHNLIICQIFYNIDYYEPRVNILCHRNMTSPTVKYLLGNYQMDIYCNACTNHKPSHNLINCQIFYNIDYYEPQVNILCHRKMTLLPPCFIYLRQFAECFPWNWTQNKILVLVQVSTNMPIEHCQFKKEIFNWKTVLWHNNNIINVSIKVECCININKTYSQCDYYSNTYTK